MNYRPHPFVLALFGMCRVMLTARAKDYPDDPLPLSVIILLFNSLSVCLYGILVGKRGVSGTSSLGGPPNVAVP
jgi:hypothetical protein